LIFFWFIFFWLLLFFFILFSFCFILILSSFFLLLFLVNFFSFWYCYFFVIFYLLFFNKIFNTSIRLRLFFIEIVPIRSYKLLNIISLILSSNSFYPIISTSNFRLNIFMPICIFDHFIKEWITFHIMINIYNSPFTKIHCLHE
jgi:hypothetical protein